MRPEKGIDPSSHLGLRVELARSLGRSSWLDPGRAAGSKSRAGSTPAERWLEKSSWLLDPGRAGSKSRAGSTSIGPAQHVEPARPGGRAGTISISIELAQKIEFGATGSSAAAGLIPWPPAMVKMAFVWLYIWGERPRAARPSGSGLLGFIDNIVTTEALMAVAERSHTLSALRFRPSAYAMRPRGWPMPQVGCRSR